jgi:hypothetical protein
MSLLPFFTWCDGTSLGVATRSVTWAFPAIETTHILALAVLLGSILLIDLRILGLAVPRIPAPKLQRELNRNINWSLVIILASGVPLFLSEALKAYDNDAFRPKIILLTLAIIFHYSVHNRTALNESPGGAHWGKALAIISLVLWFGVGAAGRAIGFV